MEWQCQKVIKGIGIVTCVYVNPELARFLVIDYRLYDPDRDCRSKLEHLLEMWRTIIHVEKLPFRTVLIDSWYAAMKIIKEIEKAQKIYYCPLKANRQVSEDPAQPYQRVDALAWSAEETAAGKTIHMQKFPVGHQVKLFRLAVSTHRTDYVVTNDLSQNDTQATKAESALRWKIEQFHREAKQVTGLEGCQCRSQRAQDLQTRIFQIKQGLLSDYMRQQLRAPSISMRPA